MSRNDRPDVLADAPGRGKTSPSEPGRGRTRLPTSHRVCLWLLSAGVMLILGGLAGRFLVPPLVDRYYIGRLLAATDQPPPAASRWWTRQLSRHPDKLANFVSLWQAVRNDSSQFVRLGRVIADAGLMGDQPAGLQIRYHRFTQLSSPSAQQRVLAVDALSHFADQADGELAESLRLALDDDSPEVVAEAVFMLPTWSGQDWAIEHVVDLLHDPRVEVRRRGALAAAVAAQATGQSAVGRSAFIAIRDRLVELALTDRDMEVRANSCWGLFRTFWMARSALFLVSPMENPPEVRRMAALILANLPIESDHTEPVVCQQVLEQIVIEEEDDLCRQRAGLGLILIAERGHLSRPVSPKAVETLLRSRQWPAIAIGARLAGLTRSADNLDLLLARVGQLQRPDPVSEQLAFALGCLAEPPSDQPPARADDQPEAPQWQQIRQKAIAGLVVLNDPSRLTPTTGPDTQPDQPTAAPKTAAVRAAPQVRLAVAAALGRLGEPEILFQLAAEEFPTTPAADQPDSATILADLACLELARLANARPQLAGRITEQARRLARDYADRSQRSGALLIGLLADRDQRDWLADRYHARRAARAEKLTVIYTQIGLLLLGDSRADEPIPAADWLNDDDCLTPGILAGLALSGRLRALDELLGLAGAARQDRLAALIDDWPLRQHVAEWLPPMAQPIPAADPDLADLLARMTMWWYRTHRHRLTFDPADRLWRLRDPN